METVNQDNKATAAAEQPERTFTQSEMEAILGERLAREKAKFSDYETLKDKASRFDQLEEASKTELQKAIERGDALETELKSLKKAAEVRKIHDTVSAETGVPANLLTADTEEECRAQAEAILAFKGPQTYPTVRDAGETKTDFKGNPKQQFADWANQMFG